MIKLFILLFAWLLSGVVVAADVVDMPTPCFDSKQVVALLNKTKARKVASEVTYNKEVVIMDSIWYNEDSIFSLREFKTHNKTCVLSVINHKGAL